jgi:hypothetical protein
LDDAAGTDRSPFVGSVDQWVEDVEQLAALGIDHILLQLPVEQVKERRADGNSRYSALSPIQIRFRVGVELICL